MKESLEQVVTWYQNHARKLPWREDKNPYHIWISEIMLQQTRIEAVKKYYKRFLERLPEIKDLASIEEEELLKLWEGLGYYSRARSLKRAAQIIMEKYHGSMPTTYEELIKLPGIGEYTASAIASIAFLEKVPAVDGNVLRVISRLIGSTKDVLQNETKKEISELLKKNMPEKADLLNEGIMELGELVCLPNGAPLCYQCPLQERCVAKKKGLTLDIPVRIKKLKKKIEEKTVFLLIYQDEVAILKRSNKGLLANLYEFVNVESFLNEEEVEKTLKNWNVKPKKITYIGSKEHIFTHIIWKMKGYRIEVEQKNSKFIWCKKEELEEKYVLPVAFSKWTSFVEKTLFDL